jgi:hypothetical protein
MKLSLQFIAYTFLFTIITSTSAIASPSVEGRLWSIDLGYEMDIGSARDPGDRDGAMMGETMGLSLGGQRWLKDWLAIDARFVYQGDGASGPNEYSSNAWRLGVGARAALPKRFSPYLSLGLAYDSTQTEWSIPNNQNNSYGSGTDSLSGIAGTAELGLALNYREWSLSAHFGVLVYLSTSQESDVDEWIVGGNMISQSEITDWISDDYIPTNLNFGLRLARSF